MRESANTTRSPQAPRFAHEVERSFARALEHDDIRWLYEPHTFVLERWSDGRLKRAFTPDFYLPDVGVYIECTVASKRCTRIKRRKAEAAARLYGIIVSIVYREDMERIARRWSLGDLERSLDRYGPATSQPQAAGLATDACNRPQDWP